MVVSLKKQHELEKWMEELGIKEAELEEKFIRSQGKGGQNVNKLSTCVFLHHLPSGIQVKYQKTRSQADNRFFARRLLCEKLDTQLKGEASKEQQKIEKLRRQKRKRSKRAKEKMLENKRKTSEKKETRKKVIL
ncbi:MAG: peptide chain release factor-like protein [Deltaproteobacteria bacterium CG11_big_fil_rev_8_21_14_0_20_42_23]|nr:MAG: peptide chain release factor-like protein [Deltaproteobacteria bacterium CG11_big_fil_rev_8_21_14_0_20_42_23]PJC63316.1 MAG: peptide chain release factor-like protein [Deltaproteobacteria bacterium CG_4_9_14_0_2_um_filter_42_21]